MKKLMPLCLAFLAIAATASAQNYRLEPLSGIPSAHMQRYMEMPTTEPVLFSVHFREGWTGRPSWIYATDSTELVFTELVFVDYALPYDTNTYRLAVDKADMDSLLSLVHSAVATSSYFDLGDQCNIPDTISWRQCMDCTEMILMYHWRWAMVDGVTDNRNYNTGNLYAIFLRIQKAVTENNVTILKTELPYIYDLAATFRSYYPKTKIRLIWW